MSSINGNPDNPDNPDNIPGISVYSSLIGKTVTRKDGFKGEVLSIDGDYVIIKIITPGRDAEKGRETIKFGLSYIVNPNYYTIVY